MLHTYIFCKPAELGEGCKENCKEDTPDFGRVEENQYKKGCRVCQETAGAYPPPPDANDVVIKRRVIGVVGKEKFLELFRA